MGASEPPSGEALYRDRICAGVVGHVPAKDRLATLLQAFADRTRSASVLVLGPPGCGKGTLGRALCAAVAPLPSLVIEHSDELAAAFAAPAPAETLVFVKNVDHLCRDAKQLEAWLTALRAAGSMVVATAALSVTAVGLELLFDEVVEVEGLTKREIEGALLHPAGMVMAVVAQSAKRGLGIIFLPEAKRVVADAASSSGRGMNFLRSFAPALARAVPSDRRGDWLVDRDAALAILRDLEPA